MKVLKRFFNINPDERYFLFTDGSYNIKSPTVVGLGAELRNNKGDVVLVYSEKLRLETLDSQILGTDCEKIALMQALKICKEEGVQFLIVNTDSSGLSTKVGQYIDAFALGLEKKDEMRLDASLINNKLFDCIELFKEIFIEFIPRELNRNADFYSRGTLELSYYDVYSMDNMPSIDVITKKIKKDIQGSLKIEPKKKKKDSGTSLKIVDLAKHDLFDKDKKSGNALMIDIQDDIKSEILTFRVFRGDSTQRNIDEYQLIKISYNQASKVAIIFFIVHNLVGENSTIDLLINRDKCTKSYFYNYNDKDWSSFDNLSLARKYYKTFIYMSEKNLKLINKYKNIGFEGEVHPSYYSMFHRTIYNNQVDYFVGVTHNQALLYIDKKKINEANERSHMQNLLNAQNNNKLLMNC